MGDCKVGIVPHRHTNTKSATTQIVLSGGFALSVIQTSAPAFLPPFCRSLSESGADIRCGTCHAIPYIPSAPTLATVEIDRSMVIVPSLQSPGINGIVYAFTNSVSILAFSMLISLSALCSMLLSLFIACSILCLTDLTEDWDSLMRSPTAQSANRPSKK